MAHGAHRQPHPSMLGAPLAIDPLPVAPSVCQPLPFRISYGTRRPSVGPALQPLVWRTNIAARFREQGHGMALPRLHHRSHGSLAFLSGFGASEFSHRAVIGSAYSVITTMLHTPCEDSPMLGSNGISQSGSTSLSTKVVLHINLKKNSHSAMLKDNDIDWHINLTYQR